MADISDVENAVVGLVAATLYPNGFSSPSALTGKNVQVFRGWPNPKALADAMAAGTVMASVYTDDTYRNTSRFMPVWQTTSMTAATVTMTVSGNTVTIGGTIAVGQNCAIVADNVGASHSVQSADTLTSIATALAALIGNGATNSGPVITLPNAHHIGVDVGVIGTSVSEVSRQVRRVHVNLWCTDPATRDLAGGLIVPALAGAYRVSLPDGTVAQVKVAMDGLLDDTQQKERLYRRSIVLEIEYPTTQTAQNPTVTVVTQSVTPDGGGTPIYSISVTGAST